MFEIFGGFISRSERTVSLEQRESGVTILGQQPRNSYVAKVPEVFRRRLIRCDPALSKVDGKMNMAM